MKPNQSAKTVPVYQAYLYNAFYIKHDHKAVQVKGPSNQRHSGWAALVPGIKIETYRKQTRNSRNIASVKAPEPHTPRLRDRLNNKG